MFPKHGAKKKSKRSKSKRKKRKVNRIMQFGDLKELQKGAGMFAYLFVIFHDNTRPSNITLRELGIAQKKLKGWEHDVNFGQVNITGRGEEYRTALRIEAFPAIRFYKKEFPYTYDGGKNADMMVSWIKRRIRGKLLPTIDFDTP